MHQIYVEKKVPFRIREARYKKELEQSLGYDLADLRSINLYYRPVPFDDQSIRTIFSEPFQDTVQDSLHIPRRLSGTPGRITAGTI